ncbi:MAG: diaminopimelate decarboxylase, partial [Chloroflexota bacterium]
MSFAQSLFPLTAHTNESNHFELGGCDVVSLAEQFGTPLYVYDETTLREQATRALNAFRSRWNEVIVLYATKAYFAPFLAHLYCELGLGLDVTSEGEIVIARHAGFDSDKIYVHGNNKTPEEIRAAFDSNITHFVVDNLDEISRLSHLASVHSPSAICHLLIRLSPNI